LGFVVGIVVTFIVITGCFTADGFSINDTGAGIIGMLNFIAFAGNTGGWIPIHPDEKITRAAVMTIVISLLYFIVSSPPTRITSMLRL
jgi:hypothetical protein